MKIRVPIIMLLLGANSNNRIVLAEDTAYASYYVANDGNVPNPKGDGFIPIPQRGKWKSLEKSEWKMDSFNWNKKTDVRNKNNQCRNRALGLEDQGLHRQSPVILQNLGRQCTDEHKMHGNHNPGHLCSANQIEYNVTNHNLRADFSYCTQTPFMDVSNSRFLWDLQYIEIVCPSNHVRINKDGIGYKNSDCELVLAHSGTGEHERRMFHLSVLLNGDDDEDDHDELEVYLQGWETKQKAEYETCGWDWKEDLCTLKKIYSPTVSPTATPTTAKPTASPKSTSQHSLFPSPISSLIPLLSMSSSSPSPSFPLQIPASGRRIKGNVPRPVYKPSGGGKDYGTSTSTWQKKAPTSSPTLGDDFWLSKNLILLATTNFNKDTNDIPYDHKNQVKPYKLFRDTKSDYYYRYQGSMTHPPCAETVMWVVMRRALKISNKQVKRLENLIAKHVEQDANGKCYLGTVGRERDDGSCKVDVNRELQYVTKTHNMTDCTEWATKPPTAAPVF